MVKRIITINCQLEQDHRTENSEKGMHKIFKKLGLQMHSESEGLE